MRILFSIVIQHMWGQELIGSYGLTHAQAPEDMVLKLLAVNEYHQLDEGLI